MRKAPTLFFILVCHRHFLSLCWPLKFLDFPPERTLGGIDAFLPYIKDYFTTFKGKSITTAQWKDHLYAYWTTHGGPEKVEALDSVDWGAWLHGEGIHLPVKMEYDESLAQAAYDLAQRWDNVRNRGGNETDFQESDLESFNSNQISPPRVVYFLKRDIHHPALLVVFLEKLQSYPPLPPSLIHLLGSVYKLADTPNAEVRLRYYQVALTDTSTPAAKDFALTATRWVIGDDGSGIIKGRMKFCRPMFKAVAAIDKDLATSQWNKAKDQFHPVARKLIDKVNIFIFISYRERKTNVRLLNRTWESHHLNRAVLTEG